MKCLKSYKTKDIIRISDSKAENMVGSDWKYVSKSEWKLATRKPSPVVVESTKTISDSIIKGYEVETISEKQLKRKKNSK